jgi:hypothetical protein
MSKVTETKERMQANDEDMLYKRVQLGILWLSYYFEEWYDLVDPETLDMRVMGSDILSQIFESEGGFRRAVEILKAEEGDLGNNGHEQGFTFISTHHADMLTEIWRKEINKRTLGGLYE